MRKILLLACSFFITSLVAAQVSVIKFGAIGDGKKLNTNSIQNTINYCAMKGGGTVVVPSGTFLTGSIELKSNQPYLIRSALIV